jgi:hypothetical protein
LRYNSDVSGRRNACSHSDSDGQRREGNQIYGEGLFPEMDIIAWTVSRLVVATRRILPTHASSDIDAGDVSHM